MEDKFVRIAINIAKEERASRIARNIVSFDEKENLRILKDAVNTLIHKYNKLDIDLEYMSDMPSVIYCNYKSTNEDLVVFNISYDWNDGGYDVVGVDENGEDVVGNEHFDTLDEMVSKFADYIKKLDAKYEGQ